MGKTGGQHIVAFTFSSLCSDDSVRQSNDNPPVEN